MTIIVTGAGGMLGNAVVKAARAAGQDVVALNRHDLDVTNAKEVRTMLGGIPASIVINCAGIVRAREAEVPYPTRWGVNATGPGLLAREVRRLVQVSTDCVFRGILGEGPYTEASQPAGGDWYGMSKLAGEVAYAPHVTVRGSFIGFGSGLLTWFVRLPWDVTVPGYTDHVWCGSYVADYADALVAIARNDNLTGIVHLVTPRTTKAILLRELSELFRPDIYVEAGPAPDGPRFLDLRSVRTGIPPLPAWRSSLHRMAHDYIDWLGVVPAGVIDGTYEEDETCVT